MLNGAWEHNGAVGDSYESVSRLLPSSMWLLETFARYEPSEDGHFCFRAAVLLEMSAAACLPFRVSFVKSSAFHYLRGLFALFIYRCFRAWLRVE